MNPADSVLFFLHVPKTAGTTLYTIIERQFGPEEIYPIIGPDLAASIAQFKSADASAKRGIRLVRGHMPFGLHQFIDRPATYVTMLRDPIDRVVSDFYYVFQTPDHPLYEEITSGGMDIATYFESRAALHEGNDQTRLLSGVESVNRRILEGADTRRIAVEQAPVTHETLTIAQQNLATHFISVGISERFDESVLLLREAMGWRNVFYLRRNITRRRPAVRDLPAQTISTLRKHYSIDIELYEDARERFEDRVRQEGRAFRRELARFRVLNNVYARVGSTYHLSRRLIDGMRTRRRSVRPPGTS